MIKLLVERDRPPTFNLTSDQEVARHARISVNAIAELAGRYHWLCTFATEEKLFSVIAVDSESTYEQWVEKTNADTVGLKIRRVVRVLDPSWRNSATTAERCGSANCRLWPAARFLHHIIISSPV
jgi:hypothetical protein